MKGLGGQDAFDALVDPTRRVILEYLADQMEATAGDIARNTGGVGRTAVSNHLRVLREAGLVTERKDGRYRWYALTGNSPVHEAVTFLQRILNAALPDPDTEATDEQAAHGG